MPSDSQDDSDEMDSRQGKETMTKPDVPVDEGESGYPKTVAGINSLYWIIWAPITLFIAALGVLTLLHAYEFRSPQFLVKIAPMFILYSIVYFRLRELSGGVTEDAQ